LLLQALAAAACPLALDVPVHEELGRHDVKRFADVFAGARLRTTATLNRAGGVFGFVAMFNAVIGRNVEVVKVLLSAGCSQATKNDYGQLVIDYARNILAPVELIKALESAGGVKRGKR